MDYTTDLATFKAQLRHQTIEASRKQLDSLLELYHKPAERQPLQRAYSHHKYYLAHKAALVAYNSSAAAAQSSFITANRGVRSSAHHGPSDFLYVYKTPLPAPPFRFIYQQDLLATPATPRVYQVRSLPANITLRSIDEHLLVDATFQPILSPDTTKYIRFIDHHWNRYIAQFPEFYHYLFDTPELPDLLNPDPANIRLLWTDSEHRRGQTKRIKVLMKHYNPARPIARPNGQGSTPAPTPAPPTIPYPFTAEAQFWKDHKQLPAPPTSISGSELYKSMFPEGSAPSPLEGLSDEEAKEYMLSTL
jgi:hypothetical protein